MSGRRLARLPGRLRLRPGWTLAAALVVVCGSLGAFLAARSETRSDATKQRLAFHLSATNITATLQLAIQHEEDLVINASAFVGAGPKLTAGSFDRWLRTVKAMQRYPELENIGLVEMVPAARLSAFEQRLAAQPVEPFGPGTRAPSPTFEILPPGKRPFYCLAVAGMSRNADTYLPAGLDYCAFARSALTSTRTSGRASYAPFMLGSTTTLGIETPVYRGGVTPETAAARRAAFRGWLGELLAPQVLLSQALRGHPQRAVTFRYGAAGSHIVFHSGRVPAGPRETTSINLHNGWTVRTSGPAPATSVLDDPHGLTLLIGGFLLSLAVGLLGFVLGAGRRRALSLVREKTRELSHQALHDALTGLPNRTLVMDRAAQMLARTARESDMVAGALFVDVDGFKHVNDNLGHAAGDRLLEVVSERLQRAVREGDTVGRLGGDEFVVLVESRAMEDTADLLADRLVASLREPIELDPARSPFRVTVSIGVAVGQYASPDALLRDADLALYAAKAAGKDRYSLFEPSMNADAEGRAALETDLQRAVEREEFFLLYQPIFDLRSGEVSGMEALIRWRHPLRGVIAPDSFIPVAEEIGLIVPIGRWVLERACRQAGTWASEGREVGISVNVSAEQLEREDFVHDVRGALAASALDPSLLMLEITETTLMNDVLGAARHLRELKRLGVLVAIDDFGTGYASLSQLQRMPVDVLKIDRTFVAALGETDNGAGLLEAILNVGRSLSLRVIAEGIETHAQLETLRTMSCEMAQGYHLGRPGPAEAVEALLGERRRAEKSRTLS